MDFKYALLHDLIGQNNAHMQGIKQVFISNDETSSALTQFAYGVMQYDQESGVHEHATMDEYFYFLKGNGVYNVGSQSINITPSSFVRIPAGVKHNLINKKAAPLEFIYFGIAV